MVSKSREALRVAKFKPCASCSQDNRNFITGHEACWLQAAGCGPLVASRVRAVGSGDLDFFAHRLGVPRGRGGGGLGDPIGSGDDIAKWEHGDQNSTTGGATLP